MADMLAGERVGAFVVLTDEDGCSHAVRCHAVLAMSDADGMGRETVLQLSGNRMVTVRRPMREVLGWFS